MNEKIQEVTGTALALACFLIIAVYGLMIDLKGVSSDEGIRLGIINAGQPFLLNETGTPATWDQVLKTNSPYAYQPLYFLTQNTLTGLAQTKNVVFLRLVNLCFLWVCLQGLIALSQGWQLGPRLFLLGVFSFNAYLFMHVLQIREYILGVAFYIWSTWFVLHLDVRKLGREWTDVAWFSVYGVLLALGYYTQSWVVFPVVGQFLFLIVRRNPSWRFYIHLALSYLIVLSFTWPYLHSHQQKVDIGRWGAEKTALWPQLSDGFHLVLSGHTAGHSLFTDFLFWFWLVVIGGAALLSFRHKADAVEGISPGEFKRQGALMVLSMLVPLAFQVGYFLKMDNLSVWPRYFVIHYFFLFWLVALAFNYLWVLHSIASGSIGTRRVLTAAVSMIATVMVASGVYQTRSYYEHPFQDTGLSRASNWRTWAAEMSRVTQPDDVVLAYNFIGSATLTFTRPIPNQIVLLQDLEASDLRSAARLVYLESEYAKPERSALAARTAALGFKAMTELPIHATDGKTLLPEWRVLVFSRR